MQHLMILSFVLLSIFVPPHQANRFWFLNLFNKHISKDVAPNSTANITVIRNNESVVESKLPWSFNTTTPRPRYNSTGWRSYTTRRPSNRTSISSHYNTTIRPWNTTTRRPWHGTTRRPSYVPTRRSSYRTTRRPWYRTTRRSWRYGTTRRPWYRTTRQPWRYGTTRRPWYRTTRQPWRYGTTRRPWYRTTRQSWRYGTTRRPWYGKARHYGTGYPSSYSRFNLANTLGHRFMKKVKAVFVFFTKR